MSMSCFDCHDYMNGYNRGKKEGLIEELEQIKAEIAESFSSSVSDCIYIIDNRISELKGENNK